MWKNIFIIVATVIIIAVVTILTINAHKSSEQIILKSAQEHQLVIAKLTANEIESFFSDRKRALQILSSFSEVQKFDNVEMPRTIERYFEQVQSQFVTSISVYNEKGTIVFSTNAHAIGLNYSSCDFFQFATYEQNISKAFVFPLIDDSHNSEEQHPQTQCIITVPVYHSHPFPQKQNTEKKFLGVLSMAISLDKMITEKFQFTKAQSLKQYVTVFDKSGAILYHPTSTKAKMKNVFQRDSTCYQCHTTFDYIERMLKEKEGTTEYELNKTTRSLSAFTPIEFENTSWIVVIHQPLVEITTFINNELKKVLLLLSLIAIAIIVSSSLIYRNYRNKIHSDKELQHLQQKQILFEKIQESEEKYRRLLEMAPDAIAVHSEGKIVYVNSAAMKLMGAHNEDELIGKPIKEIVHPDSWETVKERIRLMTEEEKDVSLIEEKFVRLDGSSVFVEVAAIPFLYEGKQAFQVVIRDITERKLMDYELNSSRTLMKTTFDSIPDAIIVTDAKYIIVSANNAASHIFGYKPNELIGKSYNILIAPEMFTDVRQPERQRLLYERGFLEQEEFLFKRKNGEIFHASYSVALVRDIHGNVTTLVGSIRDTTEHKQMEIALRTSEEKYRSLVELMNDGILIVNNDDVIQYVNIRFCEMFGYSKQELLGNIAREFLVMSEKKIIIDQMNQRRTRGISDRYELEMLKKSGEIMWTFVSASPVVDEQQNIIGSLAIITDISEMKQSEIKLKESEERYRNFFEYDLSGNFIADVNGNFIACNPSFVRIFGCKSKEEIMKWNLYEFFSEAKQREKILETIRKEKKIENKELELVRCDGKNIHVIENEVGIFNEQGELMQTHGFIIDVTGRKTLEEQFRQAQKLESIGTLAGGIAHDLNNILTIILGHSSLLKRAKGNPEKVMQSSDAISKAVDRGAGVIRQLLTFARKTDVLFETVNINESVMEILKMLHETFPRSIEFSSQLDGTIPNINADRNQLYQALLNLCVNARDAMPEGGTISLSTKLVSGSLVQKIFYDASDNEYARINVSDSGFGMDEEIKSRIFEPFFTTKEKGKGTGLGLSVVFGVIKSHQGFIGVESEKGKGTTFSIYLPIPLRSIELSQTHKDDQQEIQGGTETLLVIEDEDVLLDLVKSHLESNGYTVIPAKDGEEAVSLYYKHSHEISLVLSDLGLPKLGGWEAFLKMKDFNPKLKTIFASGYVAPNQKSEYFKSGVKDFVQKPYSPIEILRKIRAVLEIPSVYNL